MRIIQDIFTVVNGLILPVGNLGYTRNSMPQIDDEHVAGFMAYLQAQGIDVAPVKVRTKNLRLTQNEINKMKVFEVLQKLRRKVKMAPFFYSSDHYVLDGSHRFVAQYNMDKEKLVQAWRIDTPMANLIKIANLFPGVKHRTVSDRKLEKPKP
jgi:hypothetical protein